MSLKDRVDHAAAALLAEGDGTTALESFQKCFGPEIDEVMFNNFVQAGYVVADENMRKAVELGETDVAKLVLIAYAAVFLLGASIAKKLGVAEGAQLAGMTMEDNP